MQQEGRWDWNDPLARWIAGEMRESQSANRALNDYAAMATNRSIKRLYEQYRAELAKDPGAKVPRVTSFTMNSWSTTYQWSARVARAEQIRRTLDEEKLREARLAQRLDLDNRTYKQALEQLTKAEEMMKFPLVKRRIIDEKVTEEVDENGQRVKVVTRTVAVEPSRWRMSDAAKMLETAQKVAMTALGMQGGGEPQKHVTVVLNFGFDGSKLPPPIPKK